MCVKALAKGAILGGLTVFIWSSLSWMALPWHNTTLKQFTDEAPVAVALRKYATAPGIYLLPGCTGNMQADMKKAEQGPFAFISVRPGAKPRNFMGQLGQQLLTQIVGAFLLTWLVLQAKGVSYKIRLRMVVASALLVGILGFLPDMIWWEFPLEYTLINCLDLVIGWILAGLVIARFGVDDPPAEPSTA